MSASTACLCIAVFPKEESKVQATPLDDQIMIFFWFLFLILVALSVEVDTWAKYVLSV
jgi:hypothetical protein